MFSLKTVSAVVLIFININNINSTDVLTLTNNRCLKQPSLTTEPNPRQIDTIVNSNFISILKSELTSLSHLTPLPGSIQNEFYCSNISNVLIYANPIAINKLPTLTGGLNYLINLYFLHKKHTTFCLISNIFTPLATCVSEIRKIATLLNIKPPTFPTNLTQTFKVHNLPFSTYVLLYAKKKLFFSQDISIPVCGYDADFKVMSSLQNTVTAQITENVKTIFYFILPLGSQQTQNETLITNDVKLYNLWNNFPHHAPSLLRSFYPPGHNFSFPTLILDKTTKTTNLSSELNLYILLLETLKPSIVKRSILDYFLHGDQVSVLASNNHVSRSNTLRMNRYIRQMSHNQRQVGSSLKSIYLQEKNLTKSVKFLQQTSNQIIIDSALFQTSQVKYAFIEAKILRLDDLFTTATMQNNLLIQHISAIINLQPSDCHIKQSIIICPSSRAHFILSNDLFYSFEGRKFSFVHETLLTCLPFFHPPSRFQGHKQLFITKDDLFLTRSKFHFNSKCLENRRACPELYAPVLDYTLFGVCNFIHSTFYIAINCVNETAISLANGTKLNISNEPVIFSLKNLPLKYRGELFSHQDVQLSFADHYPIDLKNQHNLTSQILKVVSTNPIRQITRPPALHTQMKDFVVPDEFKGSHVILIICVVLATIKTCLCFCCILKHKKSRERLFACCTPTPSQANVQQPNLIPYQVPAAVKYVVQQPSPEIVVQQANPGTEPDTEIPLLQDTTIQGSIVLDT